MTPTSVLATRAIERALIHEATCRARRQELICSTCIELDAHAERAVRVLARLRGWAACRACGEEDHLIGGLCEPCRVAEAA